MTTAPATPRTSARTADLLMVLAVVLAALAVVLAARAGLGGPGGVAVASAATTGLDVSVTDLGEAGPDGRHVQVAVELHNTGATPLVVDADWFRIMNGELMVPVIDPASVPPTPLEPGDSVTVEPRFAAPPAGQAPRLEVVAPDESVVTLLLPPLQAAPAPPGGEAPARGGHG